MYDPDPAPRTRSTRAGAGSSTRSRSDPLALGMPPKSLASIEPFQLLALITAQAALRDAGYATRPFDRERTSVILGAGGGGADLSVGYTVRSAFPSLIGDDPRAAATARSTGCRNGPRTASPGMLMNVAAGRIANRLDFGGTNFTVDAACASSLAAIGLAVRELQTGTQRHGAGRRRRRDPEPVRVPVLRQDARALPARALPPVRCERRRHRDQRGVRRPSCSSAWPTPSATATASTP